MSFLIFYLRNGNSIYCQKYHTALFITSIYILYHCFINTTKLTFVNSFVTSPFELVVRRRPCVFMASVRLYAYRHVEGGGRRQSESFPVKEIARLCHAVFGKATSRTKKIVWKIIKIRLEDFSYLSLLKTVLLANVLFSNIFYFLLKKYIILLYFFTKYIFYYLFADIFNGSKR